jgi:uncharacterized protein
MGTITKNINKVIPAHIFKYGDKYFLFDINTTYSFEIDELVYYTLQHYYLADYCENETELFSKYSEEEIERARLEIEELLEKGFLGEEKEMEFTPNPSINSMTLHVVHACNMRCMYCYGEGGNYGADERMMSLVVAKKSIDFLIEASGEVKDLFITFFGGEPLLNKELIISTVQYAEEECSKHSKNISFSFTSNGTLISDDFMEFMKEHKITVLISMDGGKDVQDKLRPLNDKSLSSYDTMAPKIMKLNENVRRFSARATITKVNTDILQMKDEFRSLGFGGCAMTVVESDNKELKLVPEDYEKLKSQYKIIAKEILEDIKSKRKNNFRMINIYNSINSLYRSRKRIVSCGAGNGMLSVTPEGGFYPCQRFAENKSFAFGDIFNGLDYKKREEFLKPVVFKDEKCKKCWIRGICAGGCWHERLNKDGTEILQEYPHEEKCDLQRYIYELSIAIYNEIMDDKEALENIADKKDGGSAQTEEMVRF